MGQSTDPDNTKPSVMWFTTPKAASVFIHRVAEELSTEAGLDYFSVNKQNLDEGNAESWRSCGCCFAPLRSLLPSIDVSSLDPYRIILHLRDPRDVLTSLYFSLVYSHPAPSDDPGYFKERRKKWIAAGIDRCILEPTVEDISWADKFRQVYARYCEHLLGRPNTVLVSYEEMVTDFRTWLEKVVPQFGVYDEEDTIGRLFEKHRGDFRVEAPENRWIARWRRLFTPNASTENARAHRRRVTPGDYMEKLQPRTIEALNELFKDVLLRLDYEI